MLSIHFLYFRNTQKVLSLAKQAARIRPWFTKTKDWAWNSGICAILWRLRKN